MWTNTPTAGSAGRTEAHTQFSVAAAMPAIYCAAYRYREHDEGLLK